MSLSGLHWTEGKSRYYEKRLYSSTISIHYNEVLTEGPQGTWLEMMGQGCRVFEEFGTGDFEGLFQLVLSDPENFKITRLDVAFDDHSGLIDLSQLLLDTRKQEYISKFRDWDTHEGSKGSSVDHGSQKSDIYLRIYDKAAERGLSGDQHWVRVELQLRAERAKLFIMEQGQIGKKFCGVLSHYLRYVDPTGDSNKRRWPTKAYWSDLIGDASRIALYVKPGTEYNLAKFDNFVFRQAGNAIWAARQMYGIIGFEEKLKERGTLMNPKYESLVEEYKKSRKVEEHGKKKSEVRAAYGQGHEVHRAIPGGQLLGEAGEPGAGHGGTPGAVGTGMEPAAGADLGQAPRNDGDPGAGEEAP